MYYMRFQLLYTQFICRFVCFFSKNRLLCLLYYLKLLFFSNYSYNFFSLCTHTHMHISLLIFIIVFVSHFKAYFTFQIMRCGHIKCHAYVHVCALFSFCTFSTKCAHINPTSYSSLIFFPAIHHIPKVKHTKGTVKCESFKCTHTHTQTHKEHYMQFSSIHPVRMLRDILKDCFNDMCMSVFNCTQLTHIHTLNSTENYFN